MMNTTNAPTGQKKPDGTLTTQTDNQTFIMQVFFNRDSKVFRYPRYLFVQSIYFLRQSRINSVSNATSPLMVPVMYLLYTSALSGGLRLSAHPFSCAKNRMNSRCVRPLPSRNGCK